MSDPRSDSGSDSGPDSDAPLVLLTDVSKDHRGLRPLRIKHFQLHRGQMIGALGFDQTTAEVLVNLILGATVPDAGEVRTLGQLTTSITDVDVWLQALDQFGLVSERAVLLEQLTAAQNLAMPFSLELFDLPSEVAAHVSRLAAEVGIGADDLHRAVAELSPTARTRVRLGRALALDPRVLLAEHPNAAVQPQDVPQFAADLARIAAARKLATLVMTADPAFARAVGGQVLTLNPATGELKGESGWRRWFS